MANRENKYPDNALGMFYVDNRCIDCDQCRGTAPNHFKRNDDRGYSYVYKQPGTEEEMELCGEAMDLCPTKAIGKEG